MTNLIERLRAELKATQENEHRLAEANKPLLARACKAEADRDHVAKLHFDQCKDVFALNKRIEKLEAENEKLLAENAQLKEDLLGVGSIHLEARIKELEAEVDEMEDLAKHFEAVADNCIHHGQYIEKLEAALRQIMTLDAGACYHVAQTALEEDDEC